MTKIKRKTILLSISIIAVMLGVANIIASAAVATTGHTLQELQQQVATIEQENQQLERNIATVASFATIATKADSLGLNSPSQTVNITSLKPLAQLP